MAQILKLVYAFTIFLFIFLVVTNGQECKDDGDCPTNMCLPSLVSKCINFICECTHSMSTD
ncbi:Nodule Cysteine-Rich (NCR) secreted peptide [Medicago truncatula]|uniref:Nodule Cysteine-Rich (NCR) secreted peptide n=1 Tax=Medicago truncatula TaxID=3880 RepID=G7JZA9_MEDTR|nr:Nodule Cysteine-Rich (NCR) secreted peptide [Medicago truncatula]KEH27884.1 Nodule Cysteine-Rich (NCR) secreted peptide [Medicago truncatula]